MGEGCPWCWRDWSRIHDTSGQGSLISPCGTLRQVPSRYQHLVSPSVKCFCFLNTTFSFKVGYLKIHVCIYVGRIWLLIYFSFCHTWFQEISKIIRGAHNFIYNHRQLKLDNHTCSWTKTIPLVKKDLNLDFKKLAGVKKNIQVLRNTSKSSGKGNKYFFFYLGLWCRNKIPVCNLLKLINELSKYPIWLYTAQICEVKGPNDRLSHKQILWIDYLVSIGVDAEACYVKGQYTQPVLLYLPAYESSKRKHS